MLSISGAMGAVQAGGYFSREDYYLKESELGDNSRWCGEGARGLGMEGPVLEADFKALCRGESSDGRRLIAYKVSRDPATGELVGEHRAGFDCTFSAPKSVSIAYAAGVKGVKEAHDAAVMSVLKHLEEHYGHYRTPEGIRNGALVAAKFDHATSRNVDPQLHSHVFLLNAVHARDGSWKAHEPKAIFQDQKSLGLLYRQALAHELSLRGFGVEITDRSQMFIELKGIDPRLIEYFSSRRQAIEEQVERWRSEGLFSEVPHARLYEMAALESRDPKRAITKEEVDRIFEHGFESCGSSREAVRRELETGREMEAPRSFPDADRVVGLAVRDLTEREAVLDRARVLDEAVRISGGAHSIADLNAAIDGGAEGVLRLGTDARGREFYTTTEMRALEARNLARIRELPVFRSVVDPLEVEAYLDRLSLEGVRLTAGQKAEVVNELCGSRGVALSMGDPGTAKTSTLKIVERFNEEVLLPQGRKHLSVNLAYTGKAARELSLATGRTAATLDSFENGNPASKFALQGAISQPPILEVAGEKLLIPELGATQVVLRVDEAGFLGARQAEHLLELAEGLQRRGARVKLHLLGDAKQMQGIKAGDLLRQVQELGGRHEVDYAHLTEILRQRDPELLEIAKGLNREDRPLGENARQALADLEQRGELTEIPNLGRLRAEVVEHYLEESRKPSNIPERAAAGERQRVLLVTGTNAARNVLNREIRSARVAAGEIGEGERFSVLVPARQGVTVEGYRLGDTVLFSGSRNKDGGMERWGARLNTEARVTGLDRERNRVQVTYSFKTRKRGGRELSRTVTKEFSAAEMAGRTALYREEERNFSAGDRIVALKNDARLDLQNGALGVIRELDEKGRALVDLEGREVRLDLNRYRHLDHAYAVTVHKSQGATVEHSIMYAPVRPQLEPLPRDGLGGREVGEEYGRTSYNALNVAVTRAQFGTRIFTNSVEGLTRAVETVDGKTSTLKRIAKRSIVPELPGRNVAPPGKMGELGARIEELERTVTGAGAQALRQKAEKDLASLGRAPQVPGPLRDAPRVPKSPGRELELTLPRGFEKELER